MKSGIMTDIDWKLIGATLARAGDDEQATFLKAFIAECQSWGTHYQIELQLAAVNHKLTKEERECLSMLSYEEKGEN